jgi:hypothetical protein
LINRSFGRSPKRQRRVSVAVSSKSGKTCGDHRSLVDRRPVTFLEIAQQPARGYARMPARILPRDQDCQLECVSQVERRQFLRYRLCDGQVPALQSPLEDC